MTDTPNSTNLMTTTALEALIATVTPAERASGRFMRAPDHGEGDAGGGDGAGSDDDGAGSSGADDSGGAGDDAGDGAGKGEGDEGAGDGDQAGDDKGDDKSLMSEAGKKDEPDPATLPPEKYELAAPEGFTIDDTLLSEADPVFRELGLSNEQANQLMPLVPKFAERLIAQQNDAFQAMKTDWAKEAKADKELGGANWAETENLIAKAFAAAEKGMGDKGPERVAAFTRLLDETGIGNRADLMHIFRWIGSQFSEAGELARSDAAAPTKLPRETVLYPEDAPKEQAT